MPIDANDAKTLSEAGIKLGQELAAAISPDGEGGKKITPGEARRILRMVGEFVIVLVRDILD